MKQQTGDISSCKRVGRKRSLPCSTDSPITLQRHEKKTLGIQKLVLRAWIE
jgi:hypothetical protein